MTLKPGKMPYRYFGNSGLQLSVITMGQLTNFKSQTGIDEQLIRECLDHGVNHFDTAEIYSKGEAERQLGSILKTLNVPREDIVVSTKILTAPEPDVNSQMAINRKHIREGLVASLKRLQLEYVDVVYAHLYDDFTPLEQICRAFNQVIEQGLSFYWGTSNWKAQHVINALAICEKYNLHKPIGAQNNYNMLNREEMQVQYVRLLKDYGYGLIAWSPLAGGYLTGKYLDGNAEATARYNLPQLAKYREVFFTPIHTQKNIANLKKLSELAKNFGFDLVHLVLAWTLKYKHLDSLVIGPKNVEQLKDCLRAIQFLEIMTPELQAKITKTIDNTPESRSDFKTWQSLPPIRPVQK